MKELSKYKLNKISKNLDKFFNMANPLDIKEGREWYIKANKIVTNMAKFHDVDPYKVASVMSALSPRNKWEQNIIDTDKVCDAWKKGIRPEDIKVCTFHTNKFKAFAILDDKVSITDKSLKTFNFVRNIAYLDPTAVTIDIWHLRACFDKIIKINSVNIGRKAYAQIKELTLKKAERLGIKGYEYQAIIWTAVRNKPLYIGGHDKNQL
tara:strand:+ start:141 stop:764 length:624 start_codon:yes stop_codon:yes gene_type:complete